MSVKKTVFIFLFVFFILIDKNKDKAIILGYSPSPGTLLSNTREGAK